MTSSVSDRHWKNFAEDILEAIGKIQLYITHMSAREFKADSKTSDAVIRNLAIIGEAFKHIPRNIIRNHPELNSRAVTALRNILAHEYFWVDQDIIWNIITTRLGPLRKIIGEILRSA